MFHFKTDLIRYLSVFVCQAVFDFWGKVLSKLLLWQGTVNLLPV